MSTLPLFWRLSSASKSERINASVNLIDTLEHFQSQVVPPDSAETSDDEAETDIPQNDGLDTLNAQDVAYSIRRLIRGLASPRESSRLGFAVALTELLSRINTVTCSQIVALIMDSSKTQGSMTGQEERDVLFARLFGFTTVIQSSLLVRTSPLPSSASSTTQPSCLSDYQEVFSQLVSLGQKKSWLRESVCWTIILAIDAVQNSDVPWKQDAIDYTIQRIFVEDSSWSPERVAITLKLQKLYPENDWRKLVAPSFKNPDLLTKGNLPALARILKECPSEDDDDNGVPRVAARSWNPRLHFVWGYIIDWLLPGPNSCPSSKASFEEFFKVVVDESLFSANSSSERKYWGFEVFRTALPRMDAGSIPMLFTKNFMRCWINHLAQKDRYLHTIAMQVATEIQVQVQQNPTLGITLILQLTGVNGSHQFDKLTRTKTVATILSSMDTEGIKNYVDYLVKQVNEGTQTEQTDDVHVIKSRRSWIVDQLTALIHNGSVPKSDEWVQSVLSWLAIHGLFVIQKTSKKSPYDALRINPNPPFSDDLRQTCRTRLLSCLSDLTGYTTAVKSGDKILKVNGVASDGEFWISKIQKVIEVLDNDTKHLNTLVKVDNDRRNNAREIITKLQKISGPQRDSAKGAELLLAATLILHRCTDEQGGADEEALEACVDASARMFFDENKKDKHKKKTAGGSVKVLLEPVDIFVDTIIGYLDTDPAYMRSIVNHAFSLLCDHVKESTIDLILAQLERRNPAELADEDNEDDENDGSDEESGDTSCEAESTDDQDNSACSDDEGDLEIRGKLEEALRANGIDVLSDDETDDESKEEELMDDDQMMTMDEHLAVVFRERAKNKSVKNVDVQRQATHFKNRVLDLVDIYLKKQRISSHSMRCILPLVDLVTNTSTDEQQLADKAKGILKSRVGNQKEVPSTLDHEQLTSIIGELHTRARKAHARNTLETLSRCSLYLSRLLLRSHQEEPVLNVYRQSLVDFITRKNSTLNTGFFEEFVRQHPLTVWKMRFDILDLNTKAVNIFRQCQVFHLVEMLLTRISTDDLGPDILQFMPSLRESLHQLVLGACNDEVSPTIRQMKDLFKLGLCAIRQTKKLSSTPEEIRKIWQPTAWNEIREIMASSKRFNVSTALQSMCQQMTQLLESPSIESASKLATKRKTGDVSEGDNVEESKKAKKKKVKLNKN